MKLQLTQGEIREQHLGMIATYQTILHHLPNGVTLPPLSELVDEIKTAIDNDVQAFRDATHLRDHFVDIANAARKTVLAMQARRNGLE